MPKKVLSLFLCLLLIFSAVGCSDTKDAYLYFELNDTPSTLDPQIASEDEELIVIKNIFEGLLRKDEKGNIVCGAAESFEKDGLTYTFKLRKNAKWSNSDALTSNDFAFAFKRAVDPATKSPYASRLFAIKNAQKIYNGKADLNSLGVKAVDDKTLIITLEKADDQFENTLTTSVAMPCNEKFFSESAGKYGLFSDNIISNGSYKLTRWRKDPFGIRLYSNNDYNGEHKARNAAVFLTCVDDETPFERLSKNSVDMAFIESTQVSDAENIGLNTVQFQNICWVLTIGNGFTQNVRKSLSMLVGSQVYMHDLPEGCSAATSLFPDILDLPISSAGITVYDPDSAKKLFLKEAAYFDKGKFPSDTVLYYYDDGNIKNVVTDIVGHWQSNLSAFVNIESVSDSRLLLSQLTSPTYSMCFFPVKVDSMQVSEYLEKFGVKYNGQSLESVQQKLLSSNNIVPVMFQNTSVAYTSALKNVSLSYGDGYVDFAFILKEE